MEANELIERYVNEVSQQLPRKGRDDIRMELQSLLLDDLEERAGSERATVEMAAALLREYGSPKTMAAKYLPERYLIGPQLFPVFRLVLIIVLAVITVGMVLSLLFTGFAQGLDSITSWVGDILLSFVQSMMSAVGAIAITFAIIERVAAGRFQIYDGEGDWNPLDLPKIEDRNRIKRPELVVGIVANIIFIIIFNFFPHWIGIYQLGGESRAVIPILSPDFAVFIPWLTLLWSLGVVHKLLLLRDGYWRVYTRGIEIGIKVMELFIMYNIVTNGAITTMEWLDLLVRFGLWIGLVVGSIEVIVLLFRLITGRSTTSIKTIIGKFA